MFNKQLLLYALIGLNIALIISFVFKQMNHKTKMQALEEKLKIKHRRSFEDLTPTITYLKDERVSITFRQVPDWKNQKLQNCLNPNTTDYKQKLLVLKVCLPLFKEYIPQRKSENLKLIKNIPGTVPKFGEATAVAQHYPFNDVDWKKLYQTTLKSINIIDKLGFYKKKIKSELYDDFPDKEPDFDSPHMGIWNMANYCHVHDILIQHDPSLALTKKYFITDYHQMSLPRLFVMNKIGEDLMPKISKNMSKLNYLQKLYPIDFRANMFFFKKSSVHYHHKIGENFACFGQSYNHIPGHGAVIRKDLLNKTGQEWLTNFASNPKCKSQLNYFIEGFRLHNQFECNEFFKILHSPEYKNKKKTAPNQYILKVGYGVHRGAGVHLLNDLLEKEILEQYESGSKCGQITDNILAQKYIHDPLLFEGHKFDFRIYMMIASVKPLKIYYHDGFLRLSLFKYFKNSTITASQITNTELSKQFIKNLEAENKTHDGKTPDQLREFQMKTLDELSDYLNEIGRIQNKNWSNDYLRVQFKNAFLSLGKMIENRLHKSADLFEMFGVDLLLDSEFRLYILEVNASPMVIGTNKRKTALMESMLNGIFNIAFAQQYSRTKNGLEFIDLHRERILNAESVAEIKDLKNAFDSVYVNLIRNEYKPMLENNSWHIVYDGSIESPKSYHGLVTDECAAMIDNVILQGK